MPNFRHSSRSCLSVASLCCLSLQRLRTSRLGFGRPLLLSIGMLPLRAQGRLQLSLPSARCYASSPCAPPLVRHQHRAGSPPWGSLMATVFLTRLRTCSSAGGAPALLLCELSISLYCRVLITLQACVAFLPLTLELAPLTLELEPHRKQLALNAPGLASSSSLVWSGDKTDPKQLSPTCKLHSYTPPTGML
jgi:hypothetical protein